MLLSLLVSSEKDDANFKLMSECVKAINLHRLVGEERDTLSSQMFSVIKERDLLKDALVKWEEKERGHETAHNALERELGLEKQLVEMHKKKVGGVRMHGSWSVGGGGSWLVDGSVLVMYVGMW